jgi:hypothetical protein
MNELELISHSKILGLVISDDLKWNDHVYYIIKGLFIWSRVTRQGELLAQAEQTRALFSVESSYSALAA